MKLKIANLLVVLLFILSQYNYCQVVKKTLPDGWQYKELKFPEGSVQVPVPIIPKEDEWINIMVDEFENNKKMVTMMVNKEGYSVYLMPQLSDIDDPHLSNDIINYLNMLWVDIKIKESLPDEKLSGRKYYCGYYLSSNGKKVYNYTTFMLLGKMLYSVDVSTSGTGPINQELCRLIATYLFSPDEIPTNFYNPGSAEDKTGKTFREEFNGSTNQFYDYNNYCWHVGNGELSFSSTDTTGAFIYKYPGIFSDFTLTAKARWTGKYKNFPYGLYFRGSDHNFYVFSITQDGYYQLAKHYDKDWIKITEWKRAGNESSGFADLKVTCSGPNIKCYVNSKKLVDIIDQSYSKGEVGLFAEGGVKCSFDDFYVGPPEVIKNEEYFKEDFKGNITQFTLNKNFDLVDGNLLFAGGEANKQYYNTLTSNYSEGTISANIKWTGGDDGIGFGITFGNFENCRYNFLITQNGSYRLTKLKSKWQDIVPWTETDEIETDDYNELRITFVNNAIRCYINDELVISTFDESIKTGKIGLTSAGSVSCSCNYFEISPPDEDDKDDIEDYKDNSLFENFEGEECTFDTGNNWIIKNGKMYFVNGDKTLYYRTRCDDDYQNYTVSVKTKWEGGVPDEEFGLFFGKEEDAYYIFTIRNDGTYSLSKWTGYLWKAQVKPVKSDLIINGVNELKVTCVNNRIIAHLNNVMVVNIEDNLISRGYVGIFISGSVSASFDDFRVADPEKF